MSPDTHEQDRRLKAGIEDQRGVRLNFPLLSDSEHRVIDRYGILNPDGPGIPHPAVYVIDRDGIVRWKFLDVDYKIRATNAQIQDALEGLK